jgi:hypothetical protein
VCSGHQGTLSITVNTGTVHGRGSKVEKRGLLHVNISAVNNFGTLTSAASVVFPRVYTK